MQLTHKIRTKYAQNTQQTTQQIAQKLHELIAEQKLYQQSEI